MMYFTSDVHFNNKDTLINDNRNFKSTKKFDKFVIKTWNKQVDKSDTIYVIGDFVDCDNESDVSWKKSILYVKKIKTNVVLILGNNEERVIKYFFDNDYERFKKYCLDIGFKGIYRNLELLINNQMFYLVHKLIHCKKDIINLYGHSHRACGIYSPLGFNVGCDLNHFRLYSEDDIKSWLSMKSKYWDKDKNLNLIYKTEFDMLENYN